MSFCVTTYAVKSCVELKSLVAAHRVSDWLLPQNEEFQDQQNSLMTSHDPLGHSKASEVENVKTWECKLLFILCVDVNPYSL